jgi:serine/threonine protein kinase
MIPWTSQDLIKVKELGNGVEGAADLVQGSRDGCYYVVKSNHEPEGTKKTVTHEAVVLFGVLKSDHWFSCRPVSVDFEARNTNLCRIVLSYCDSGTLDGFETQYYERCQRVPESMIWHAYLHISMALIFLHTGAKYDPTTKKMIRQSVRNWNAVYHRDLHPGNVLMNHDGKVDTTTSYPDLLVTDFGHSDVEHYSRRDVHAEFEGYKIQPGISASEAGAVPIHLTRTKTLYQYLGTAGRLLAVRRVALSHRRVEMARAERPQQNPFARD